MPEPPRVKICGVTRRRDGLEAAALGASYVGAVVTPGFRRSVTPDGAAALGEALGIPLVAVVVNAGVAGAARAARAARAAVLQLHGSEEPDDLRDLREEGPWRLWKAVRVREAGDVQDALARFGGVADALLLEGWHPTRVGGSGSALDWEGIAPLRRQLPEGLELVLAGGLTPANVARAVYVLEPDVVDVSSGVERAPGVKDPERMRAFLRAVHVGTAVPRRP